jgi:hypothetical protein
MHLFADTVWACLAAQVTGNIHPERTDAESHVSEACGEAACVRAVFEALQERLDSNIGCAAEVLKAGRIAF